MTSPFRILASCLCFPAEAHSKSVGILALHTFPSLHFENCVVYTEVHVLSFQCRIIYQRSGRGRGFLNECFHCNSCFERDFTLCLKMVLPSSISILHFNPNFICFFLS